MVILEALGVVVVGYLLVVAALAMMQRSMIYHPGHDRAEPAEVGLDRMVPVPVRATDGWIVTGWYAPPSDARAPTVVFFHGNGGTVANRARKARAILEAGYGLYLVGYRGYGGNPGRPSEKGLCADGRGVMQWFTTRGLTEAQLVLYGESLGSGVALQMALEHPDVAAVVLEAPFTRLPDLAPPILLPGLAELLMVDTFDNIAKIPAVKAPLLVVHGEKDTVVPAAMGRKLLNAADSIKEGVFLPDAGHNDVWEQGGDNAALDFLQKRVRQ